MSRARTALVAVAAIFAVGCASASAPSMVASGPEPAGPNPSESAKEVCAPDAQREIELSLSLRLTAPVTPTWANHLYSCRYSYAVGGFTLSVKELSDQAATDAYYGFLRTDPASQVALRGLGQAAFTGGDGIIVVRKDYKVLRVDATGLPAQFGQPPMTRAEAARRIASDIMACWNGS
ncbi:MAG TPA: hypothetical protein VGM75_27660 [Pseudonocardiaceae bacterium]